MTGSQSLTRWRSSENQFHRWVWASLQNCQLSDAGRPERRPRQVNQRLQHLARAAGLHQVNISSHSGRRGLASKLVRRGASTTAIQVAGGWRSAEMVLRYAAAVNVKDGAVSRHLG